MSVEKNAAEQTPFDQNNKTGKVVFLMNATKGQIAGTSKRHETERTCAERREAGRYERARRQYRGIHNLMRFVITLLCALATAAHAADTPSYALYPIGWVRKADGRTTIEIEKQYQPAMLGLDQFDSIWVLYWFDRNDNPEQRAILQVHPRRNPENPLRGVFATRAPVRPNLIALSRCRILAIEGTTIEIDGIDAYPNTPVLDIKP